MKKQYFRTILALLLLAALVVPGIMAQPAMAASGKVKIVSKTYFEGEDPYGEKKLEIKNLPKKAKLISAKSSNEDVLAVWEHYNVYVDKTEYFVVDPCGVGKSKVTVTYKLNGKKYNVSAVFTVKEYPHPFKYIKLNGKDTDIENNRYSNSIRYDKKSATIDVKLNKGWKIVEQKAYQDIPGSKSKKITIKFGKKLSIPKHNCIILLLKLKNEKGETLEYRFELVPSKYWAD